MSEIRDQPQNFVVAKSQVGEKLYLTSKLLIPKPRASWLLS